MDKLKLHYTFSNYRQGTYRVGIIFYIDGRDYHWSIKIPSTEVIGFDKKEHIIYVKPEFINVIMKELENHTFNEVSYNARFNPSKIEF